jgi:hypothetical protein
MFRVQNSVWWSSGFKVYRCCRFASCLSRTLNTEHRTPNTEHIVFRQKRYQPLTICIYLYSKAGNNDIDNAFIDEGTGSFSPKSLNKTEWMIFF